MSIFDPAPSSWPSRRRAIILFVATGAGAWRVDATFARGRARAGA